MNQAPSINQSSAEKGRVRLLMHGSIIAIIGLISGFGLLCVVLDALAVWPFFSVDLNSSFPGSVQDWRLAHVAGVLNGLMMMIIGMAVVHVQATLRAQAWIVWGMVYTGWANTLFFHLGNFPITARSLPAPQNMVRPTWLESSATSWARAPSRSPSSPWRCLVCRRRG